jgi:lambda repressor-like predicted transcriptional regulator
MTGARAKFGAFIRAEREAKGLSLRLVAKKIKVSPTFLSKVETADWMPGEEKLRLIAGVISCDADDLVARAGRVPSELSDIIKQHPHRQELAALLRTTKGLSAEDMSKLVRQAERAKHKSGLRRPLATRDANGG